jgi:hypothetical protein
MIGFLGFVHELANGEWGKLNEKWRMPNRITGRTSE